MIDDSGQSLIEYILIVVLIVVVLMVIWALLGPSIEQIIANLFNSIRQ